MHTCLSRSEFVPFRFPLFLSLHLSARDGSLSAGWQKRTVIQEGLVDILSSFQIPAIVCNVKEKKRNHLIENLC